MAGRKVFTSGEILTASDVNSFLMNQVVAVFADDDARSSAIPSPSEGMITYLEDTDAVEKFDGSNFVPVSPEPDPSGLIAVKSVLKTNTFTASVGAGGNVAVPGLSITHEVSDPANRLIISAFFGVAGDSNQQGQTGLAVDDGSGLIASGASAGVRTAVTAGARLTASGTINAAANPSVTFVHTPGAGSKTYTVRAINITTATQTLFINRSQSDGDLRDSPRGVSSITIQEVAV